MLDRYIPYRTMERQSSTKSLLQDEIHIIRWWRYLPPARPWQRGGLPVGLAGECPAMFNPTAYACFVSQGAMDALPAASTGSCLIGVSSTQATIQPLSSSRSIRMIVACDCSRTRQSRMCRESIDLWLQAYLESRFSPGVTRLAVRWDRWTNAIASSSTQIAIVRLKLRLNCSSINTATAH